MNLQRVPENERWFYYGSAPRRPNIPDREEVTDEVDLWVILSDRVRSTTDIRYQILRKPEQKILNNSISSYKHRRDGAMWIPDVYKNIKSFLSQDSRRNLWEAHSIDFIDRKPYPYKFVTDVITHPNPSYILWSLRQLPIELYYHINYKYMDAQINHDRNLLLSGSCNEFNKYNADFDADQTEGIYPLYPLYSTVFDGDQIAGIPSYVYPADIYLQ